MGARAAAISAMLLAYGVVPVVIGQCHTPSGSDCQIGPATSKFPSLFVPDLSGSISVFAHAPTPARYPSKIPRVYTVCISQGGVPIYSQACRPSSNNVPPSTC